jgi:hypothetical protein
MANVGIDLPELALLPEIFHEQLDRQTALDLELAVDAGLRLLQHLLRQIGREDFDPPSAKRRAHFLQTHGERIGLLAGRAGRAPDPQAPAMSPCAQHLRHDRVTEGLERHFVAKEERLVGGHGFDHLGDEAGGAAFHFLHEVADPREACLPRQRKQATLDQILLVGGQIESRMISKQFTQVLVIGRGHKPPLEREKI